MTFIHFLRLRLAPLAKVFGFLSHAIYPYHFSAKMRLLGDYCYTYWIRPNLKHAGSDIVIHRPLRMIGGKCVSIGNRSVVGSHGVLTAWTAYGNQQFTPQIEIGADCDFGEYIHITSVNCITIGNGVLTGRWVTISDNAHGYGLEQTDVVPALRDIYSKGPITICDNVWIGDKATILSGVTIGEGAIVAANSVVTHDVPPHSIVAGSPATVVKQENR